MIRIVLLCLIALPSAAAPRLGVIVVFDQLRAADISRLTPLFGSGGFGSLQDRGAHFDALYPYAVTETGPGHATLATGTTPDIHGIDANRWWRDGKKIYSVDDERGPVIGDQKRKLGPGNLRVDTLGDAMKFATDGKARVITMSLKDRAAILTGGHRADLALWFNRKTMGFTTSQYYKDAIPAWVLDENRGIAARVQHATWTLEGGKHSALLPRDDHEGEYPGFGGRTFPHNLKDLDEKARSRFYYGSPTAIDDTFRMAKRAIVEEKLGQDEVADLLVISISPTDYVGHWFGMDSLEGVEIQRAADRSLRNFVSFLDNKFGRNGFALIMSSDHGGPPLTERVPGLGKRIDGAKAELAIDSALQSVTKDSKKRVLGSQPPHLWIDTSGMSDDVKVRALRAAATALQNVDGIRYAQATSDVNFEKVRYGTLLRNSCAKGRTGDILFGVEPYAVLDFSEDHTGADHGSPYRYDRAVPIMVIGPGVKRGRYSELADPRDVAPTMAFLLGMAAPSATTGTVLPIFRR